jgi:predicted lipoprotein with Yx(FWY)xxD motif
VGEWSLVRRADGADQWAWRGKPVYTFAKDAPEKPTGDGLDGVWRLLPTVPAD